MGGRDVSGGGSERVVPNVGNLLEHVDVALERILDGRGLIDVADVDIARTRVVVRGEERLAIGF